MARITVSQTAAGLTTEPDPPAVGPGDVVTWVLPPNLVNLKVVFKRAEFANGRSLLITDQGPFIEPLLMTSTATEVRLVGTIANVPDGRYLCEIHNGDNGSMKWAHSHSQTENLCGLDIPRTPPFA